MQEQNTVERHIYHLPTVGYSRQTGTVFGRDTCGSVRL